MELSFDTFLATILQTEALRRISLMTYDYLFALYILSSFINLLILFNYKSTSKPANHNSTFCPFDILSHTKVMCYFSLPVSDKIFIYAGI